MISKKIYSFDIRFQGSNLETKQNLRIPIEYKKIKGMFLFDSKYNTEGLQIGLIVDNTEIVPDNFHAELIQFKGLLAISDVMYSLDIENKNQLWEFKLTRPNNTVSSLVTVYFVCEE